MGQYIKMLALALAMVLALVAGCGKPHWGGTLHDKNIYQWNHGSGPNQLRTSMSWAQWNKTVEAHMDQTPGKHGKKRVLLGYATMLRACMLQNIRHALAEPEPITIDADELAGMCVALLWPPPGVKEVRDANSVH
jgi:hypothetical protein